MEAAWENCNAEALRVLVTSKKVAWEGFQPFLSAAYIVHEYAKSKGVSPVGKALTLTHNADEDTHDVSVCLVLPAALAAMPGTEYKELPAAPAIRKTFTGSYGPVIETYCTLPAELTAKGKKLTGPIRTIYVTSPADGVSDAGKWVTEVQALVS